MHIAIIMELGKIAYKLKIREPKIIYRETKDENSLLCELDLSNYALIFRTNDPTKKLGYQMAYAMRRIYQLRHNPSVARGYRYKGEVDDETFARQPAEIDAHAYAHAFVLTEFYSYMLQGDFSDEVREEILAKADIMIKTEDGLFVPTRNKYPDPCRIVEKRKAYSKNHRKRWRPVEEGSDEYVFWYPASSTYDILLECYEEIRNGQVPDIGERYPTFDDLLDAMIKLDEDMDELYPQRYDKDLGFVSTNRVRIPHKRLSENE